MLKTLLFLSCATIFLEVKSNNYKIRYGNPEERGPYPEGDLVIPVSKNGIKAEAYRWNNAVIPYEIQSGFSQNNRNMIERAFQEYHKNTCIRFVKRTSADKDYISIENRAAGCSSMVGRVGGRQVVNLQPPDCFIFFGTSLHELMHVVGFKHEQNRDERDNFVVIRTNNIQPGREKNFDKAQPGQTTAFGTGYDYSSIMHYSAVAFSKNGQPTIEAKTRTNQMMGQRDGFTKLDIQKINRMYKC